MQGIQIQHWESVANLLWLSKMTHLLTLIVLRDEVRSNKALRFSRITGMAILISMLIGALLPVGYELGVEQTPNFPAWCLYNWQLNWKPGTGRRYECLYMACTYGILSYGLFAKSCFCRAARICFNWYFAYQNIHLLSRLIRVCLRSSS